MKCSKCGVQQEEGKFCGKCGGALISVSENQSLGLEQEVSGLPLQRETTQQEQTQQEVASTGVSEPVGTNESIEKVKETSRAYGSFFKRYIKQPSLIFTRESSQLTNGLISIGIVILLTTLAFYTLINNAVGDYGMAPSFLSVFGNTIIGLLVAIAIVVSLLFLINKFFGTDCTYKEMIGVVGVHITPVIVIAGLAFILSILKSNTYSVLLLLVGIALILSVLPLYIISSLLTRRPKGIDPLYGYISYIIAALITFSILMGILVDSALGNMIDIIDDMMYYM